jgi:hypothetical protein
LANNIFSSKKKPGTDLRFFQALHIDEHQVAQEDRIVKELELLKDELAPLEDRRKFLSEMVKT